MRRKTFALLSIALSTACAPDAGEVEMAVLQWNPDTEAYELRPAVISTLEDVLALRGEAATPIGSAQISLYGSLDGVSERQFRNRVLEDEGGPVEAQFVEVDGVLYPSDFHSLNLATAYFNFEQARRYALARGMSPEKLRGAPFYYFPELRIAGREGVLVDNAAWYPLLRSFILYPFDSLQDVPLAMNLGVIAHEFAHGLFHAEVYGESWLPGYFHAWCLEASCLDPRGLRMLGIVEEGFADAWALGVTGDPRFLRHSIYEGTDRRNPVRFVAEFHCYSQAGFEKEIAAFAALGPEGEQREWNVRQYQVGTVLAGALYRAGTGEGTTYDRVMEALLASYPRLATLIESDATGEAFGSFAAIAAAVIDAAPDDATRRSLCAAWMDRLSIGPEELGARCDGISPGTECNP